MAATLEGRHREFLAIGCEDSCGGTTAMPPGHAGKALAAGFKDDSAGLVPGK